MNKKNGKKKIVMSGVFVLMTLALVSGALAAVVGAYTLVTAVQHITINEGVQLQYLTESGWSDLPVDGTSFDLDETGLKPGESKVVYFQAKNMADNGAVDLYYQIEQIDGLSYEMFGCSGDYSFTYDEANDNLHIGLYADKTWKGFSMRITAAGNIPVGTYEFDNLVQRDTVLGEYADLCTN